VSASINGINSTGLSTFIVVGQKQSKGKVVVTVSNPTSDPVSGLTSIFVYASMDDRADDADPLIGKVRKKLKLKSGASATLTVKVKVAGAVQDGDYHLLAGGAFGPDDAGTAVSTTTVRLEQPRVTVTALPYVGGPAPLTLGKKATLSVPIVNGGNVPAKGTLAVDVIASTDSSTDADKSFVLQSLRRVKVRGKPNIDGKLTLKLLLPMTLPAGFIPGAYSLLIRITDASLNAPGVAEQSILTILPATIS
jgi:hypothetical protein